MKLQDALQTASASGAAGMPRALPRWVASAKAEETVAEARTNLNKAKLAVQEAENAAVKLRTIRRFANMLYESLFMLDQMAKPHMDWLQQLTAQRYVDYNHLSRAQQQCIFLIVSAACALNSLINTPILNERGNVTRKTQKRIKLAKNMFEHGSVDNTQLFSQLSEALQCG